MKQPYVPFPLDHPFVAELMEMSIDDHRREADRLTAEMNRSYERAFEVKTFPRSGPDMRHAEEMEERANVAQELLLWREEEAE